MNRSFSALIGAATLTALPLAAYAGDSDRALETCSQAFIEHLTATHGPAKYRLVRPSSSAPVTDSPSVRMSRRVAIDLVAKATSTGTVIASAACTATTSGDLVAMTTRRAGSSRVTAMRVSARSGQ